MAKDAPYKVVVEALAAQTAAIARLAKEIRIEFAQYQEAASSEDEARAEAIAAAINSRTAALEQAADTLAASFPGAEIGGGPTTPPPVVGGGPAEPPPVVGGGPAEPGPGLPPGAGTKPPEGGTKPPIIPDRPGIGGPGLPPGVGTKPPDVGIGGGPIDRPGTPGTPPERPEQGNPTLNYLAPNSAPAGEQVIFDVGGTDFHDGSEASFGDEDSETIFVSTTLVRVKVTPSAEGEVQVSVDGSNELPFTVTAAEVEAPPEGEAPVIDYVAPSSGKVNEDLVGISVNGSGFSEDSVVYLNDKAATKTIYVNANLVRFNDHIGTAGVVKVRVDDSNEVDFTVS